MRRMKIAIALGLLAGLVALAILADSDQAEKTARAVPTATLRTLIFEARNGTPESVQAAIDAGVDPSGIDTQGRTALTEALLMGKHGNVSVLLEAGADVTQAGRQGYTPLILAANNGQVEIINALLERGSSVDVAADGGVTALHTACRSSAEDEPLGEIVTALLDAGADPNEPDADGFTPLMVAASRGRVVALRMLIDAGAKVNETNSLEMNAITYAIMSGDFAIRAGWELDLENPTPEMAGTLSFVALAIELADSLGAVRMLLEEGADINVQDNGGWTPIMRAASLGNIDRYRKILTDVGVNTDNPEIETKLRDLVRYSGADRIVLTLRNADAYVNVPNDVGADALTISRMRGDEVGKLIHGLLLEGKRVRSLPPKE